MRHPKEISAQTLFLVVTVALVAITTAICLFIRWGGTGALVATYGLLLAITAAVLVFSMRFMGTDD